jgi:hypothetical protein
MTETKTVTILAGSNSAIININTEDKAIASIATVSSITGLGELVISTWWPIIGQWIKILSANFTPAKMPIRQHMSSIFVPSLDLRGETQIMVELPEIQSNDVIIEVKFCNI